MKKILAGLFAAFLMAAGFAAFSTSTASASPYPGTIPTYCHAKAANSPRAGRPALVDFRVGTAGNGEAHGSVTFRYKLNGDTVRTFVRDYNGPFTYKLGSLPRRGLYTVVVHFNSQPANSAYMNCSNSFEQRVRPRA